VKLLVNAGVNPLATNHIGNTILHEALDLYSDYEEVEAMVSTLLELDISPSACNHRGRTPLHIACQTFPSYVHSAKRHPINFILRSKLGESINTSDKDGIRPIHIAATLSEQLVAELIEYGADPAVVTYKGKSVLHLSAEAKCPNTVGFLLEHFVKINREDIINSVDDIKRTP
jgi:ankyrin repeat protein